MTESVIEVDGFRKVYGSTLAVEDVAFNVRMGEIFGIVGHNGSGKTTTLECLRGLRHADAGRLRVLGLDPWGNLPVLIVLANVFGNEPEGP